MSLIRKAIRHQLVSLLKNAGTQAGDRVYAYRSQFLDTEELPAILVEFDSEPSEVFDNGPHSYKRSAQFRLYAYADAVDQDLEDLLDDLGHEIEGAVHADTTLHGLLSKDLNVTMVEAPKSSEGDRMQGAMQISVTCPYIENLPREEELANLERTNVRLDLASADSSIDSEDDNYHAQNPRLFVTADSLPSVRASSASSRKTEADRLQAFGVWARANQEDVLPPVDSADLPTSQQEWRRYGNYLTGLAGAWLTATDEGDQTELRLLAQVSMDRLSSYQLWGPTEEFNVDLAGSHILAGFTIAYDLFWPQLDELTRARYRLAIKEHASAFKGGVDDGPGNLRWVGNYQHNIFFSSCYALALASIALRPDEPIWSEQILELVETEVGIAIDLRGLHAEGSEHEGPAYGSLGLHALLPCIELLASHGRQDWTNDPTLEDSFEAILHTGIAAWQNVLGLADNDGSWYQGPQHSLRWIATTFRNGRAQWLADTLWDSPHGGKNDGRGVADGLPLLYDFLWKDPTLPAEAITVENSPLTRYFTDLGVVVDREGWDSQDTIVAVSAGPPTGKATFARMKAGDPRLDVPGVGHEHPNAGQVIFLPGGSNFLAGGLYPFPKRTALCNTPTFVPASPIVPLLSDAAVSTVWELSKIDQIGKREEVGQVGEWFEWYGPESALLNDPPEAEILETWREGGVFFAFTDLTEGYPDQVELAAGGQASLGLDGLFRAVVRIGDALLIVDHVERSQAIAYRGYFRTFHLPAAPSSIVLNALEATFTVDGVSHDLTALGPSGPITLTSGREVISVDHATGVNDREITDWDELPVYSRFARFESSAATGNLDLVFLARGSGVSAAVASIDDTDPRGLTINLTVEGVDYVVKTTRSLSAPDRAGFLGDSEVYGTVTAA